MAEDGQEFIAPENDGWHYTIRRDWIDVCPDITDTAARLYSIIRSLMNEKGDKRRHLSIDQLCWLLPGINGKPTSETRVKDALRTLEHVGLISNPDGAVTRRWTTDPSTGKPTRQNYRRWQVHDLPPDPASYGGWRSAHAKLEAYPGPGWRDSSTGSTPTEGRKSDSQANTEGRKSDPQSSPGETQEDAGHTEGRKSVSLRRNSVASGRKSADGSSVTREDGPYKEVLQGSSTTKHPPAPSEQQPMHGETHSHAVTEDGGGGTENGHEHPRAAEAMLVLSNLPHPMAPGRTAAREFTPLVADALVDGWEPDQLTQRLTPADPSGVKFPSRLLRKMLQELPAPPPPNGDSGGQDSQPAWPEWCRAGEPEPCNPDTRLREPVKGAAYKCGECHPDRVTAVAGAA